jgi:ribonuclease HI
MKEITIYSDGACQGNPGPGGWAAVLLYGEKVKEISGGEAATTNNRMELRAALEALRLLKVACKVQFYTDSEYLRQGISSWVRGWKARGWMTQEKKPVKNVDLWRALDAACGGHRVEWHWVKGHDGNRYNERCDLLAVQEIARLRKQYSKAQLKEALERFKEENVNGKAGGVALV